MTRYRFAPLALIATLAVAASPALAQQDDSRWSLNLGLGVGASASGNVHLGGSGLVLGLPTSVGERTYRDVYENQVAFGFDLGYAVSERSEVFGGFSYSTVASKSLRVGNVAGLDLNAKFADYKSWGLDAGYRYFLSTGMVRPFVGLRAGLRVVDAIPSDFSVPAAGVTLAATPFYEKSTVPSAGLDAGLRFMVGGRVGIGLQTGLLWRGSLKQLEGLSGTGLENLNDDSARWSIPVIGTLSLRF